MIGHYIKIALRNLWKYWIQNLIGIIGMAIGISFFTIGYDWMEYETSYDSFHPDSERIYQVYGIDKRNGKKSGMLPMVLGEKLLQEFPEVEALAMYYIQYPNPVKLDNKELGKFDFKSVDEHFFELFPPTIIAGKTDRLLETPQELVITEDFARKYWSSPEEAVGTALSVGFRYKDPVIIVAVMANLPANSNFRAEGYRQDILSRKFQSYKAADKLWRIKEEQIFVLLKESVDKEAFEKKLQNYVIDNQYDEYMTLKIANITEVRHTLASDVSFNINYIRTFGGAGLLLMFCALFNFLNLYINRMLQRSKEMKLRKTVGAGSFSIIKLLQTELLLQFLFVFVIGLVLLIQVIPIFEQKFETHIVKSDLLTKYLIVSAATFIIMFIICLLSEIKFTRFSSLTQSAGNTIGYRFLRNSSICLQLSICVFFLMSSFVFYKQVALMNNFDWGFNSEGLIKMVMDAKDRENIEKEILQLPIVKGFVATGQFEVSKEPSFITDNPEINGAELEEPFLLFDVGNTFINTFEIPLVEGHMFTDEDLVEFSYGGSKYKRADVVVVTESFQKLMNMENVIGEKILLPDESIVSQSGEYGKEEKEIVGVIKDFHITSLQNPTYPLVLRQIRQPGGGYYNYVKVDKEREQEAMTTIKDIFKKYASAGDPETLQIEIVENALENMNKSENASLQLFSILAVLCIVIAIFGIYSISSSNMERRRKEIAIRKVSGATAMRIVRMFLAEYTKMLLVANLIALPLAFYFMYNWLMQYTYKAEIELRMFIFVFVFTLIIVVLTVLYQVVSAAKKNPAEVLKSE